MRSMLTTLAGVLVSAAVAFAQTEVTPDTPLKAGDKVQAKRGTKWYDGEVVEAQEYGLVKVKFAEGPFKELMLPRVFLRLPAGAAGGGAAKPAAAAPVAGGAAATTRTWTDATGKHKIEAAFVELAEGKVRLKKADGSIMAIPLDKLSPADQAFVKTLPKPEDDSPFQTETPAATPAQKPAGPAAEQAKDSKPGDDSELKDPDLSAVTELTLEDPGAWSLPPDAAPEGKVAAAGRPILLTQQSPTGKQLEIFDKAHRIVFHTPTQRAYVSYLNTWDHKSARVEPCDLSKGKALPAFALGPTGGVLCDVSPSGDRLLARREGVLHGSKNRLDVYVLTGNKPGPSIGWLPYNVKDQFKRDCVFAAFADDEHVVSLGNEGRLIQWLLKGLKGVWSIQLEAGAVAAISANHKQLAVASNANGVAILDPLSGKTLGRLPGDARGLRSLAFDPTGKWLAGAAAQHVMIWDLSKGELLQDIDVMAAMGANKIDWCGEQYVLVDDAHLIDRERRVALWKYLGAEVGGSACGTYWAVLTTGQQGAAIAKGLCRFSLPHDAATKVAKGLPPESLLAMKPGATVSVTVGGLLQGEEQRKVLESLTARLQANGLQVAPTGSLVLEAQVVDGKMREVDYMRLGRKNIAEKVHRLTIKENGRTIWEAAYVKGPPFMLSLRLGESADVAIAEAMKPHLGFFTETRLPTQLARPGENGYYGASTLTPLGPQPAILNATPGPPGAKPPGRTA